MWLSGRYQMVRAEHMVVDIAGQCKDSMDFFVTLITFPVGETSLHRASCSAGRLGKLLFFRS